MRPNLGQHWQWGECVVVTNERVIRECHALTVGLELEMAISPGRSPRMPVRIVPPAFGCVVGVIWTDTAVPTGADVDGTDAGAPQATTTMMPRRQPLWRASPVGSS